MVTLPVKSTEEPVWAVIVPPALFQLEPFSTRVPPPEASIVLVLVTAVNDCNVKLAPLTLALIVPLLVNVPLLMRPAPSMVSSLVRPPAASTLPVYWPLLLAKTSEPVPVNTVAFGA